MSLHLNPLAYQPEQLCWVQRPIHDGGCQLVYRHIHMYIHTYRDTYMHVRAQTHTKVVEKDKEHTVCVAATRKQ